MLIQNNKKISGTTFTINDVTKIRGISSTSARVYCTRKVKSGDFVRLKNNLYILKTVWNELSWAKQLSLANRIQVPSYISLLTALVYYELTTQMPGERIESIAKTRSYLKEIQNVEYAYIKINQNLYFGFTKVEGLFIAGAEKALADCIYLCSFGKYAFDFNALEWDKINNKTLTVLLKKFPLKTQDWWKKHGIA